MDVRGPHEGTYNLLHPFVHYAGLNRGEIGVSRSSFAGKIHKSWCIWIQENYEDRVLHHAIMMLLVVIGENAHKISKDFQDTHHEIPWKSMYGIRNVLIHAYGEVRLDQVWVAATIGVPALIRDLEPLVSPDNGIEPPSHLTPRETP